MIMLSFILMLVDSEDDKNLLTQIYSEYEQTLYKVARDFLNDSSFIEDCVQDTFLGLIKSLDRFRQIPEENRRAYLAAICKRSAYRINERHSAENPDAQIDRISVPGDFDFSLHNRSRVIEALNKLDKKYREPIIMKYAQDRTASEIAEELGISRNLVLQRLHRARKMLYEMLEEE